MVQITPNLWFDDNAEQAAQFYVAIFPGSRITNIARYTAAGPGPEGQAVTVDFELDGQPFTGINGGPMFTFSEAVSFALPCADQAESDRYWEALLADGGQPSQCGWLKDKFGLSWQIVPAVLDEMMASGNPEGNARATQAFLKMKKFDIATLQRAYEGG